MSGGDNWAPGDLALCVNNERASSLRVGACYTVVGVAPVSTSRFGGRNYGLWLHGIRSESAWGSYDHRRFRKIRPLTDEERRQELADLPVREEVRA